MICWILETPIRSQEQEARHPVVAHVELEGVRASDNVSNRAACAERAQYRRKKNVASWLFP